MSVTTRPANTAQGIQAFLSASGAADTIASDLEAHGLTVRAAWEPYRGMRAVGSVCGVLDDYRADDPSVQGAYKFSGVDATDMIVLGNYTTLDGTATATVTVWFTIRSGTSTSAQRRLWSRGQSGSAAFRETLTLGTRNSLLDIQIWNGSVMSEVEGSTTIVAGVFYKATVVYDGSQSTDATKVKMWLSTYSPATQTWSVDAQETGAVIVAGVPATLAAASGTPSCTFGGRPGDGNDLFNGLIRSGRVWTTALTEAQIRAETLTANPITPSLKYTFNGDATNTGSTAGFNGTPGANVVMCSGDLRYTGLSSPGTSRPPISTVNGIVLLSYDGVGMYSRSLWRGDIEQATTQCALVQIGTFPVASGTAKYWGIMSATTTDMLGLIKSTSDTTQVRTAATGTGVPLTSGVRSVVVRRAGSGTVTCGQKDGNATETTNSLAAGSSVATRVTLFANSADTPSAFCDGDLRAAFVVQGDISGLQYIVNAVAQGLFGASL